jgi:putative flippase GtrA
MGSETMKALLARAIDRLYFPPLRKCMPRELFRYGVCGTAVVLLDWVLFWFSFHYIFAERNWEAGFFVFSAYTLSKAISAPIAALTGFWLQKNITFRASSLRGATQFVRYLLVFCANFLINILIGKDFLFEHFGLWATPANMAVTLLTIAFSFLMQKYFTFRRSR